jgi:hypothetical protein
VSFSVLLCLALSHFLVEVQMLSCVCHILAIFIEELKDAAHMIQLFADLVFYTMMGW